MRQHVLMTTVMELAGLHTVVRGQDRLSQSINVNIDMDDENRKTMVAMITNKSVNEAEN